MASANQLFRSIELAGLTIFIGGFFFLIIGVFGLWLAILGLVAFTVIALVIYRRDSEAGATYET